MACTTIGGCPGLIADRGSLGVEQCDPRRLPVLSFRLQGNADTAARQPNALLEASAMPFRSPFELRSDAWLVFHLSRWMLALLVVALHQ